MLSLRSFFFFFFLQQLETSASVHTQGSGAVLAGGSTARLNPLVGGHSCIKMCFGICVHDRIPFKRGFLAFSCFWGSPSSAQPPSPAAVGSVPACPSATSADAGEWVPAGSGAFSDLWQNLFLLTTCFSTALGSLQPLGCCLYEEDRPCCGTSHLLAKPRGTALQLPPIL